MFLMSTVLSRQKMLWGETLIDGNMKKKYITQCPNVMHRLVTPKSRLTVPES